MTKFKLFEARKRKNYSQDFMAKALSMDVSNYSRRENGQIKINIQEWQKIADVLEVSLEQIYESDDHSYFISHNQSDGYGYTVFGNTTNEAPPYLIKYIEKIEEENKILKEEIQKLKNIIDKR